MNDRGGFRGTEATGNDHAFTKPGEPAGRVSTCVVVGNDVTAVRVHASIPPVAVDLPRETGMQRKAATRERIERAARAPVEREKPARFAGSGTRHRRAFHHDDFDPALSQKIRRASGYDTTSADHNPHW